MMVDGTTLHIRMPQMRTTRVVPLQGPVVRIGRGSQCEVRLVDDKVDEVQCVLRRRGDRWLAQSIGQAGRVRVDGRILQAQRPLNLGATIRIGDCWLCLVPKGGPGLFAHDESDVYLVEDISDTASKAGTPTQAIEPPKWHQHLMNSRWHERWVEQRQREQSWESRWRAIGEGLRKRSEAKRSKEPVPSSRVKDSEIVGKSAARNRSIVALPQAEPTGSWSLLPVQPDPVPERLDPRILALPAPASENNAEASPRELVDPQYFTDSDGIAFSGQIEIIALDQLVAALSATSLPDEIRRDPLDSILQAPATTWKKEEEARPSLEATEHKSADSAGAAPLQDQRDDDTRVEAPVRSTPLEVKNEAEDGFKGPPIHEETPLPIRRESGWPTVQSILAARGERAGGGFGGGATRVRRWSRNWPMPTEPRSPGSWTIGGAAWICFPSAAAALVAGIALVAISAKWARADRAVGTIADLVTSARTADDQSLRLAAELEAALPEPSWTNSTADQIGIRLAAASRTNADPLGSERVSMLIGAGRSIAPVEPGPRLARAWQEAQGTAPSKPGARLGLSRDALATSWSARQLIESGRRDRGLALYREALVRLGQLPLAACEKPGAPTESGTRRFALPYEDRVSQVIRDLVQAPGGPMANWDSAIPESSLIALTIARVLQEKGSNEAERALALAVDWADRPAPTGFDPDVHRAAGAEALAQSGQWEEAAARYREAIDQRVSTGTGRRGYVERSWAYNLAEIYSRMNDPERVRTAWIEALDTAPADEITTLVVQAQMRDGVSLDSSKDRIAGGQSGRDLLR
jgi:tetratricopeptide (TPR) repeat protein